MARRRADRSARRTVRDALANGKKVYSTRDGGVQDVIHVEQLLPTMEAAKHWNLPAKIVHVLDHEADSVGHMRQWHASGHLFLVRANDRRVTWRDQSILLAELAGQLKFQRTTDVDLRGRKAYQQITETTGGTKKTA